jgi:hypothetical protein
VNFAGVGIHSHSKKGFCVVLHYAQEFEIHSESDSMSGDDITPRHKEVHLHNRIKKDEEDEYEEAKGPTTGFKQGFGHVEKKNSFSNVKIQKSNNFFV